MARTTGGSAAATASPESLDRAYARCRELHRRHGRTYYLATRLLPAATRPHVHALYGFTRYTDEIVDGGGTDPGGRLREWSTAFWHAVGGAPTDDPVLPAVVNTIHRYQLDLEDFERFLASMAADLTTTRYADHADLAGYMAGSAAAIGTMMLPILGVAPGVDPAAAREPARQLGFAFQLTNFIRDVAEDVRRGRIYLPQTDLERFGVTEAELARAAVSGRGTDNLRSLIRYEVQLARKNYVAAIPGVAMLADASRRCISAAFRVYGAILTEVAAADYDVFARRAVVPDRRRLRLAAAAMLYPSRLEAPRCD